MSDWDDLLDHLVRTTRLERSEARRVVEEVLGFFSETAEGFIVRRHQELQGEQLRNAAIYQALAPRTAGAALCRPRPQHPADPPDHLRITRIGNEDMCGIVGYVGGQQAAPILMEGLHRLEYRGYDSAGIALVNGKGLKMHKARGKVRALEAALPKRLAGKTGIAHTRWATHGEPTDGNAHPHSDSTGRIAVVHNGIVENAAQLRAKLESDGVAFRSETDTEVLAHLIARAGTGSLEEDLRQTLRQVEGTYGLAVLDASEPGKLVAARNGSPVVLGIGDKEMFVASDTGALVRHTQAGHLSGRRRNGRDRPPRSGFRTLHPQCRAHGQDAQPPLTAWSSASYEKGGFRPFHAEGDRTSSPRAWRAPCCRAASTNVS